LSAGEDVADDADGLRDRESGIDAVVDGNGGGRVAASEATDVTDGDVGSRTSATGLFQLRFELIAPTQVAGHVGTDFDFSFWRWSQVKVRIEASGGVNLADGDVDFLRKKLELVGREVSEFVLDGSEFVEQAEFSASMISGD
jgi:hypothetical protein